MTTFEEWQHNIRAVFAIATPADYRNGLDWYPLAQRIASAIAHDTGLAVDAIAATISALSPRNKWARNIIDARAFAIAATSNQPEPKACTFTPNRNKAWRIVNGEAWANVLRGIKVESFIANIMGDLQRVTVDVWATRVVTLGLCDAPRNDTEYRLIELAYQTVAAELNIAPAELQAITWTVLERMCKGVRTSDKRNATIIAAIN